MWSLLCLCRQYSIQSEHYTTTNILPKSNNTTRKTHKRWNQCVFLRFIRFTKITHLHTFHVNRSYFTQSIRFRLQQDKKTPRNIFRKVSFVNINLVTPNFFGNHTSQIKLCPLFSISQLVTFFSWSKTALGWKRQVTQGHIVRCLSNPGLHQVTSF